MTNTASNIESPSFAISYGFIEGTPHGRPLVRVLKSAGFIQAPITSADIIIAHSAGCMQIPRGLHPKLVVYVGVPLVMARARHTWLTANIANFTAGGLKNNLAIRCKNTYVALRHPLRNLRLLRHPLIGEPILCDEAAVVFIANRHDPWPRGTVLDQLIREKPWAFISLPGPHDDIWLHPERYASIIKWYATQLLA